MTNAEQLQQIDRALIELLSQRIAVLGELGALSREEQCVNCEPLLAELGVPEWLWHNLVTNCNAVLTDASPLPATRQEAKTVTVVGGQGAMGQFFVEWLSQNGHTVRIFEYCDWHRAEQLLRDVDLVLVCVPLDATQAVVRKLAPYLQPSTVLADIASIKEPVLQTMLEAHSGPVLGLHPMFGPGAKSLMAQTIVACPGRGAETYQWLLQSLEDSGGKLLICAAVEHDQMMVTVQAIRHFVTFSLGVFLAEEGVDVERSLSFASPIYRMEINMVSRMFAQNASLYADIMLATPDRPLAIGRLAETCQRLAHLIQQGDRAALIHEFEAVQEVFKDESTRAMEESNHVVNNLGIFLAAREAEAQKIPAQLAKL